jgi:hypothetical protein
MACIISSTVSHSSGRGVQDRLQEARRPRGAILERVLDRLDAELASSVSMGEEGIISGGVFVCCC